MRFQRQLLIALATTVVAACAKDVKGVSNIGDIPPLAYVRYFNAMGDTLSTDFRSIDHLTYAQPFLGNPYRSMGQGGYQGYAAGSHKIRVLPNSTNIAVTSAWFVDTTLTFTANTYYTIVHIGNGRGTGALKQGLYVLTDTFPATPAGIAYRVFNVGTDLGAVDVYEYGDTLKASTNGVLAFSNVGYKGRTAYRSRAVGPTIAGVPTYTPGAARMTIKAASSFGVISTPLGTSPTVLIRDGSNNPLSGVKVTWTVTQGGGSATSIAGTDTTDATGTASVSSWTLGSTVLGVNKLTASAPGVANVVFSAVALSPNSSPVASTIAVNGGAGQTAAPGGTVTTNPSVIVKDALGNPVANVPVNFSTATGMVGSQSATVLTDATGVASAGAFTVGNAGTHTITATGNGLTGSPVSITGSSVVPSCATTTPLPTYCNGLNLRVTATGTTTPLLFPRAQFLTGTAGSTLSDPIGGSQIAGSIITAMIYSKTGCTTAAACTAQGTTLVAAPSIVFWNDLQPPRTTSP